MGWWIIADWWTMTWSKNVGKVRLGSRLLRCCELESGDSARQSALDRQSREAHHGVLSTLRMTVPRPTDRAVFHKPVKIHSNVSEKKEVFSFSFAPLSVKSPRQLCYTLSNFIRDSSAPSWKCFDVNTPQSLQQYFHHHSSSKELPHCAIHVPASYLCIRLLFCSVHCVPDETTRRRDDAVDFDDDERRTTTPTHKER